MVYGVDYLLILITVQSILGNVESIGQKKVCDMAVEVLCPKCKKSTSTRTSTQIMPTLKKAIVYCPNCLNMLGKITINFDEVYDLHKSLNLESLTWSDFPNESKKKNADERQIDIFADWNDWPGNK